MNPPGQSEAVNDRKNQLSLGASLGGRHHSETSEQKLNPHRGGLGYLPTPVHQNRLPKTFTVTKAKAARTETERWMVGETTAGMASESELCKCILHQCFFFLLLHLSVVFEFFIPPQVIVIP